MFIRRDINKQVGIKPKKYFWFYFIFALLIIILVGLVYLLIQQYKRPIEIFHFLPDNQIRMSIYLNTTDEAAINLVKNILIEKGQSLEDVESLVNLAKTETKFNLAVVDYLGQQEIVASSLYSSQVDQTKTDINYFIFEERTAFYSPNKELLNEVHEYLDLQNKTSLTNGIKERKIVTDYNLWIKVSDIETGWASEIVAKQDIDTWQWRMQDKISNWSLYFYHESDFTQLKNYDSQKYVASFSNLSQSDSEIQNIGLNDTNVLLGNYINTNNYSMLYNQATNFWLLRSVKGKSIFQWLSANTENEFELVIALELERQEEIKEFIEHLVKINSPDSVTTTLPDGTEVENIEIASNLPDLQTKSVGLYEIKYYSLDHKEIAYAAKDGKMYFAGSVDALTNVIQDNSSNSQNQEVYINYDLLRKGINDVSQVNLFQDIETIQWIDKSNNRGLNAYGQLVFK